MTLVVVGTGTDVGKTVTCAVLLWRYQELGIRYWKPVATGAGRARDVLSVKRLGPPTASILEERYRFDPPVSPHLAARGAGKAIEPRAILAAFRGHLREMPSRAGLLIEGIGGLLVPLNDRGYLLADLLGELAQPCVLVALSTLGTINHTLLTLEAMRKRRLELAGVILCGPPNVENRAAIERFGGAKVVGEIAPISPLGRKAVAKAAARFDRGGLLQKFLLSHPQAIGARSPSARKRP